LLENISDANPEELKYRRDVAELLEKRIPSKVSQYGHQGRRSFTRMLKKVLTLRRKVTETREW
jgi:hypothetical protein